MENLCRPEALEGHPHNQPSMQTSPLSIPAPSEDDGTPSAPTSPETTEKVNLPQAFREIQTQALAILDTDRQTCFHNRKYHKKDHTEFVMQCSKEIFDKEKELQETQGAIFPLSQEGDCEFSVALGAGHDIDQTRPSSAEDYKGDDEKNSAQKWLVPQLREKRITDPDHIQAALWALVGTWTKPATAMDGKSKLFQFVQAFDRPEELPKDTFPTAQQGTTDVLGINLSALTDPRTILFSKILADADLAPLGSDWQIYWKNMFSLFLEKPKGETFEPTQEGWKNWLKFQVELLHNHHYHTQAANELYPHCLTNAYIVERLLAPGNETALTASFEAMKAENENYRPPNGAIEAIETGSNEN